MVLLQFRSNIFFNRKRLGHEVIVANVRQLHWITAGSTKNDPVDARTLALLARSDVGLLAPVEHRTAEQQGALRRDSGVGCDPAGAHATKRTRSMRCSGRSTWGCDFSQPIGALLSGTTPEFKQK